MDDITDHELEFARLTGMLSPGHDEAGPRVSQDKYTREEVRRLMWTLYKDMKDRPSAIPELREALQALLAIFLTSEPWYSETASKVRQQARAAIDNIDTEPSRQAHN